MAKLNTKTSIVDYLKSQGKDSSYSARKELATSMGISNYTGTASQNTQMLKSLQSGSNSKKTTTSNKNTSNKNNTQKTTNTSATKTTKTTKNNLKGVDDATTEKINSSFTASKDQTAAQNKANSALSRVESVTSNKNLVSQDVWNVLGSQFTVPQAVTEADAYLKTQLDKIQSGKTSYTDQVKDMMSQIQNREKFSYDVDSDPLFQQALASAMNSGKTAMQDTIGQASALTGGYGSTYATTAGNQAYNAFIEDAYNNLPQYYQMAMDAYQMEGDEMYRQLGMLTDADATEYNRNLDAYDATYQHRNQMYNEAYTQFRDAKTDALNIANLQLSEHGQLVSDAVNLYNTTSSYADTLYNREYTKWADEVKQAMQYAGMLNSDWWNQTNFDEGVRQYEKNFAEDVRQFDTTFAENQRQFDKSYEQTEKWNQKDLDYRYSALKQDNDQFYANLNYQKSKAASTKGGYTTRGGVEYKNPTETQNKKALEAYNAEGIDGLNKYLNSVSDEYDKDAIAQYVGEYGELPMEQRTYTKTKDTFNWLWGNDNNDKVEDQYGNEYRVDELPESIRKDVTKLKEGQSYTKKK